MGVKGVLGLFGHTQRLTSFILPVQEEALTTYLGHSLTSNLLDRLPCCLITTRVEAVRGYTDRINAHTLAKRLSLSYALRTALESPHSAQLALQPRGNSDDVFRGGKSARGRPRAASPELREDGEAGRVPKLHPSIQAALRRGRRGQRAKYLHLRLHLPQGLRAEGALR